MTDLPQKQYLTPQEVAAFYQIKIRTLYDWIEKGKVEAERVGPHKILRIRRDVAQKITQPVGP
jgi:excisionase family DNA binding protein